MAPHVTWRNDPQVQIGPQTFVLREGTSAAVENRVRRQYTLLDAVGDPVCRSSGQTRGVDTMLVAAAPSTVRSPTTTPSSFDLSKASCG